MEMLLINIKHHKSGLLCDSDLQVVTIFGDGLLSDICESIAPSTEEKQLI